MSSKSSENAWMRFKDLFRVMMQELDSYEFNPEDDIWVMEFGRLYTRSAMKLVFKHMVNHGAKIMKSSVAVGAINDTMVIDSQHIKKAEEIVTNQLVEYLAVLDDDEDVAETPTKSARYRKDNVL